MKKLFLFLALALLSSSFLLSYEYLVDKNPQRTWSWGYHTGTTQITTLTSGNWLDGYYDLALPAGNQFYYYGRKVTHLRITTKGYIVPGFGSAPTSGIDYSNDPIPDGSTPNPVIAVLWDDYDLQSTGSMWYTLGSGYTYVEWRSVPVLGTTTSYSFSATFHYEFHGNLPSEILFQYSNVVSGNASYDKGASATVGIEHPTGLQGDQVSYNTASVNNGDMYLFSPFVPVYGSTSFYTAGQPDLFVFRPSDGNWYVKKHDMSTSYYFHWGQNLDIPVPGDYDGDTDADECVYRPSNSVWYGASPTFTIQWGQASDIPVPADYDNDGRMELAVFRPSTGWWYIRWWTGTSSAYKWGIEGDIPLAGDIDGDQKADLVIWRPSNGTFYGYSPWAAVSKVRAWGSAAYGDIPGLARDYGSWHGDPRVFRPTDGYWYTTLWTGGVGTYQWGTDGDVPMSVDWLNTGFSWFMNFRPSDGNWYQKQSGTNVFNWGTIGDKPRCRNSNLIALDAGSQGESTTK